MSRGRLDLNHMIANTLKFLGFSVFWWREKVMQWRRILSRSQIKSEVISITQTLLFGCVCTKKKKKSKRSPNENNCSMKRQMSIKSWDSEWNSEIKILMNAGGVLYQNPFALCFQTSVTLEWNFIAAWMIWAAYWMLGRLLDSDPRSAVQFCL